MSAGGALQVELAARLAGLAELKGVFDGPPARATFPYVVIDSGNESDWSHKNGAGREVMVAVTLWDEQPARLHQLADAVEARIAGGGSPDGWALVSLSFLKRKIIRDVAGPWAAAIDFRARLLADA